MNKNWLIIIWSILMQLESSAQSKWGFENYNYWGQPGMSNAVPSFHLETKNNWYSEFRYNYEAPGTFAILTGKTFRFEKNKSFKLTPMIGFATGPYKGLILETDAEKDWGRFFFSTQTEYSWSLKKNIPGFFFSWTESGFSWTKNFFTGGAIQYTMQEDLNELNPGIFAGLQIRKISVPVYVFNLSGKGKYFVIGCHIEFNNAE